MGILELLIIAMVLGTFVGALLVKRRRVQVIESRDDPPVIRDSSNPYEPPSITVRAAGVRTSWGLAAVLLVLIGLAIAAIVVYTNLDI